MPEAKFKLYLLGAPQLRHQEEPVNFDTRKALAILGYLAITTHNQGRDTLAALLWGEHDQESARASLRRTLSSLNKGLNGTGLAITRETIGLQTGGDLWIDVTEFTSKIKTARARLSHDSGLDKATAAGLEEAVELWRGDFMQGFALRDAPEFEEWQYQVAENLQRELGWALERLAGWYANAKNFPKALEYARRWLTYDSLNEAVHCQLMRFYSYNGQPTLALKQYQECVQVLERELGVPPLETTTALYESIKERRLEPLEPAQPARPAIQVEPSVPVVVGGTNLPLVGREGPLGELGGVVEGVFRQNRGHLIVIEGEAGVGKTRLVEEFLAGQTGQGRKVTRVNCYEGETEMAYVAVNTALHTALALPPGPDRLETLKIEWRQEAARLDPDLAPGLTSNLPQNSLGAQGRFYEGLRQTLLALCGSPGLLFFDDLQWMDGASLDFLAYLAHRIAEQPLVLILSWRTGTLAARPDLQQLFTSAKRYGDLTFIDLKRLDGSEVKRLVELALPGQPDLAPLLFSETEGLPYFVIEYINAHRQGLVQPEENQPDRTGLVLPGGVRDLLESRLHPLSESTRQLLQSAAIIGRVFDFDTLREVSGRSEDETILGLEELTASALVSEFEQDSPELRYDFTHEKLRGLVYEKINPARRRLLHRRVAEALASHTTGPAKEQVYGKIGHHYRLAGNEASAAGFYKLAGDYARALFANREALNYYQTALTLGFTDTALLREASGDLYTLLGEYSAALRQYQLAYHPGSDNARLEYKTGNIYLRRGDWELANSQFESASGVMEPETGLAAQVLTEWALALHHLDRDEAAQGLAAKALALALENRDRPAQARAHNMLGLLAGHRREPEVARDHLGQSLALSKALDDRALQAAALNNLSLVSLSSGELPKALELTRAALEIVTTLGDRHRQAALLSNLGDLYQALGQPEEARESVKQSVLIYAEIGFEAGAFQPGVWMLTDW